MKKVEYFKAIDEKKKVKQKHRKEEQAWLDRIAQIEQHKETVIITKQTMPSAWSFVEEMFPSVVERLDRMRVLKNDNTAFCKRIGIMDGAGGLFIRPSSTILILYNTNFSDDVVVVHELLHFISRLLGGNGSKEVEEDFAYGKSLPFILAKYSKEKVVTKYLLPYYTGYMMQKHKLKDYRKAMELAEIHCNRMVQEALGVSSAPNTIQEIDRFDIL